MPRINLQRPVPLSEICALVDGTLMGDSAAPVYGLCALDNPQKGCLSFVRGSHISKNLAQAQASGLAGLLISRDSSWEGESGLNLIRVADPLAALIKIVPLFFAAPSQPPGISALACVEPGAEIGRDVSVGPFAWIAAGAKVGENAVIHANVCIYPGAQIGARTVIHSGAVIREECTIGPDCVLHNGVVIGADGFGYIPDPACGLTKVPQIGVVNIAAGVEIGANTCIDRATLGATTIGANTKIDNLVQIGHNTTVGSNCIICGGVMIGGSTRIGNQVVIGGSTAIADHLVIADGVRIGGHAGVGCNLQEKGDYTGYPVVPAQAWRRQFAATKQLPAMLRQIKELIREPRQE